MGMPAGGSERVRKGGRLCMRRRCVGADGRKDADPAEGDARVGRGGMACTDNGGN